MVSPSARLLVCFPLSHNDFGKSCAQDIRLACARKGGVTASHGTWKPSARRMDGCRLRCCGRNNRSADDFFLPRLQGFSRYFNDTWIPANRTGPERAIQKFRVGLRFFEGMARWRKSLIRQAKIAFEGGSRAGSYSRIAEAGGRGRSGRLAHLPCRQTHR